MATMVPAPRAEVAHRAGSAATYRRVTTRPRCQWQRENSAQSLSGEPTTSKRKPFISPERRGRASWMAA